MSSRLFFTTTSNLNGGETPSKRKKFSDSNETGNNDTDITISIMENDLFGLDALQSFSNDSDYLPNEYSIDYCDDCNFWEIGGKC